MIHNRHGAACRSVKKYLKSPKPKKRQPKPTDKGLAAANKALREYGQSTLRAMREYVNSPKFAGYAAVQEMNYYQRETLAKNLEKRVLGEIEATLRQIYGI